MRMADPTTTETISPVDLDALRIADLECAIAQEKAKTSEALFRVKQLEIARTYGIKQGESINLQTGVITRKGGVHG